MPTKTKPKKEIKTIKPEAKPVTKPSYYAAVGRRKVASARARLYVVDGAEVVLKNQTLKPGDIFVNGRTIETYFPGEVSKKMYLEPLRTTNTLGRFAIVATILGGGSTGQRDAFVHAISRALLLVDTDKYRPILKKRGFLTRDPRAKERRKAGFAQKARARKQSPKR